jgi:microcystin-dependent protein
MGQPFVGEIRMFAGNFPPAGWSFCQGQTIPISENDVLFTLIGTTYGGDGQETFNLPDLRGRAPMHMGTAPSGTTYQQGETAGVETATLTTQQIPSHTHPVPVSSKAATSGSPVGTVPAASAADTLWGHGSSTETMTATSVTGGSQPHENMQPFLVVNYIISMFGVFPYQG